MNVMKMSELAQKIESVFLNILYLKPEERLVAPNASLLADLKGLLNQLFEENQCIDIIYTLNTDKLFFGVKVDPVLSATDTMTILVSDDKVKLGKYYLELDSKLFDMGLTAEELTATVLYEISSMMDSYEIIDQVRALVELHVLSNDSVVSLRDSANYTQLITYALKDTLYKVSSVIFKEEADDIAANKYIQALEMEEEVLSAQQKILSSSFGISDSVKEPKTIILKWMFNIYKDVKHNYQIIRDTLLDAKDMTASKLIKKEVDKTLQAIDNIGTQTLMTESTINKVFEKKGLGPVNEISIFKSLKTSGLKSIEDTYYELVIRAKAAETEEEAMFVIRGISTRLSILEDYVYNTPDLPEAQRKHWEKVINDYRQLREMVTKKKIMNKKQYGLFFDYSQLDYLDDNQ